MKKKMFNKVCNVPSEYFEDEDKELFRERYFSYNLEGETDLDAEDIKMLLCYLKIGNSTIFYKMKYEVKDFRFTDALDFVDVVRQVYKGGLLEVSKLYKSILEVVDSMPSNIEFWVDYKTYLEEYFDTLDSCIMDEEAFSYE